MAVRTWASRPPAALISRAARPSSSSSRTFRRCSGTNCWLPSRSGQTLRGLNEAARPLGEFLDIHALSRPAPLLWRQTVTIRAPGQASLPAQGYGMGEPGLQAPARPVKSKRLWPGRPRSVRTLPLLRPLPRLVLRSGKRRVRCWPLELVAAGLASAAGVAGRHVCGFICGFCAACWAWYCACWAAAAAMMR